MSNYEEVAELIWENGQLSMHGLGGLQSTSREKPSRAHDTLESIVQQATFKRYQPYSKFSREEGHAPTSINSIAASSGELQAAPSSSRKRSWSNANDGRRNFGTNGNVLEECDILSGCASGAGATFCRDNDTTMMTWASLESARPSLKTMEEDSAYNRRGSEIRDNQDDRDSKAEIGQSNSKRRSRTAAIHNQSERKRRDRINQKMKALQRLVPNASKTDKASMLDEVINHLKQLQAQIQVMNMTSMPQVMVPLAMQQQLQMSMLARIGAAGLGMGMGLFNINNMAAQTVGPGPSPSPLPQLIQHTTTLGAAPTPPPVFVAPSFMMPSMIQAHSPALTKPQSAPSGCIASIPLPHPHSASLSQSAVNMDILNNMAALYKQQMSQNNDQALSSSIYQPRHEQGRSK